MRAARLAALGAAVLLALTASEAAWAHGLVGKQDLPLPRWLFAWAAAVVLLVSFVALAVLWKEPRLEGDAAEGRRVARIPRVLDPICGAVGVALFALVVYAGLAGTSTPTANLAPTAVYVVVWVGVPFAALLLGDVFRPFNPWRAIGRLAGWLAARLGAGGPSALPYPERLGRWPAAIALLAFTWLELVSADGEDPQVLAVLALLYAGVQLVGMALYGVEPWTRRADGFAVWFELAGRVAPLRWTGRELRVRRPLSGLTRVEPVPGTVALMCVLIGTTSFDGFTGSSVWSDLAPELQSAALDAGLSSERALEAAFTVGLLAAIAVIALVYRAGIAGMRSFSMDVDAATLARRYAHSLVPIALAYVVAHYFSLLAYQGQAVAYLASDPLGEGADLLGTAGSTIDYGWVTANGIWYVQVGALVAGHAAALALAHDRALAGFGDARRATRSQAPMLAVMIGFTSLGLWLLSAAAQ